MSVPASSESGPPSAQRGSSPGAGLLDLARGVPRAYLFVGGAYSLLSGTVFLMAQGTTEVLVWASSASLGLLLMAASVGLRRLAHRPGLLVHAATLLSLLLVLHALVVMALTRDPGHVALLVLLLVASGYLLPSTTGAVVVGATATLGWVTVVRILEGPFDSEFTVMTVAGLLLGTGAHLLHRRTRAEWAAAEAERSAAHAASQERFRALTETAQDAIFVLDAAGNVSYLNPAGRTLFGMRSSDLGRPAGHLLGAAADDPERLVGIRELQAQRKDGSTFPAELSMARTTVDGETLYTGILRDISERQRAARETKAAAAHAAELETLRQINSFKTKFLNTAAHELNTPLTPLRLQLHLLKAGTMGPMNDKQTKAVDLLDRNVARLSGLVADILEVARMQSGRIRLTLVPVDVDAVVDEVLESFGEAARRVGVTASYDGTPGLVAHADRNRLTQVFFNLVSNAIKFTPAGGTVTVHAERSGNDVRFAVRDTGLGLSREQMGRLFQPFSQVHDTMVVTVGGTGLGLYITKGLVEAMGGRIAVHSDGPGRGCAFSFSLPAGPALPGPHAAAEPEPRVEDDALARRLRELI
jgi:PAS domain S-box-containing protein